jgi:hypothetical protein
VFLNESFIGRLGSNHGLQMIGMYHQGIIWNNDSTDWAKKRPFFAKGEQSVSVLKVKPGL